MFPSFLIPLIGVLVVVFVAFYGFTSHGYFVHLALLAAPVLIFLVNNPGTWFVAILGLTFSKLIFPGLPQGLHVSHVMMAGFTLVILAHNIIAKPRQKPIQTYEFFLIGFILIIIGTASIRGFGIRALGDSAWGGMAYIKLVITAGFLLGCRNLVLSEKQIRTGIYLMLICSTFTLIAELIFTFSGGKIYQQYMFVEANIGGLLSALQGSTSGGLVRYHAAGAVANTILMVALIMVNPKGGKKTLACLLVVSSILITGLTGFRGQMINFIGTIVIFVLLVSPAAKRPGRIMLMGVAGMIMIICAYLTVPYMPTSIQRTFSWLPGVDVSYIIKLEAANSSAWRLEVWNRAWQEVPKYFWIGKGYTVNPSELASYAVRADHVLSALAGKNYHSGPLSLQLGLGIFGFIFGSGFLVTSAISSYKRLRLSASTLIQRYYIFFLAKILLSVPSYYLIFGDVRETFPQLFITLATMNVAANVLEQKARKDENGNDAEEKLTAPDKRKQPGSSMRRFPQKQLAQNPLRRHRNDNQTL